MPATENIEGADAILSVHDRQRADWITGPELGCVEYVSWNIHQIYTSVSFVPPGSPTLLAMLGTTLLILFLTALSVTANLYKVLDGALFPICFPGRALNSFGP